MTVTTSQPARSLPIRPPVVASQPVSAPPQALSLITAVVEAMMGRRALHQLRPHLGVEAFHQLVAYADSSRFRRIQLGRVRTQMPTRLAVEACVRLAWASRWISCVIRLDAVQSSWRCTQLTVLEPTPD